VQFPTCDAAMAAMVACRDGKIILRDYKHKVWYIKAEWAKAECRDFKKKQVWAAMAGWNR